MKVVTLKNIPNVPAEGAAERTAGWTGPVSEDSPDHHRARRLQELQLLRGEFQPGLQHGMACSTIAIRS